MLRTDVGSEPAQDIVLETRKRILKALLPAAILELLQEVNVSSATNIIRLLKKRYNIQLSAGTVYPILYSLERKKKIKRISYRRRNLYVVTNKGKKIIDSLQVEIEDLQNMICRLLKK